MNPLVWKSDGTTETLTRRYEKIQSILWGDEKNYASGITDEQRKTTRERLLGPDLIAATPSIYSVWDAIAECGFLNWQAMSIQDRGAFMAYRILKNIAEICRQYIALNEQLIKEEIAKKQKPVKKSGHGKW